MSLRQVFVFDPRASVNLTRTQFESNVGAAHPNVSVELQRDSTLTGSQFISAWKKWFGIAHLLDLGVDAPVYGLMLDAEILLYDVTDCGPRSAWSMLFDRIRAAEGSKKIKAARVSDSLLYMFPETKTWSG